MAIVFGPCFGRAFSSIFRILFEYLFVFLKIECFTNLASGFFSTVLPYSIEHSTNTRAHKNHSVAKYYVFRLISYSLFIFFFYFFLAWSFCLGICWSFSQCCYSLLQHMYDVVNKYIACRPIENIVVTATTFISIRNAHTLKRLPCKHLFITRTAHTHILLVCSAFTFQRWTHSFCSCLWTSFTSFSFSSFVRFFIRSFLCCFSQRFVVTSIAVVMYLTMTRKLQ